MRLPAAAVRKGAVVLVEGEHTEARSPRTVERVESSTPEAGRLTWHFRDGGTRVLGGSQDVEVLAL